MKGVFIFNKSALTKMLEGQVMPTVGRGEQQEIPQCKQVVKVF